ncbi:GntR family transcriptional regulator [Streptomyces phaeoluteigriseus]|uniref:GntR family transcriptional regulator n=1 Tax=Streptomyces phaeoluteigriseus TaxID=114686 RepID=A0ABY4ZKS7_9ACTN|nr:GntR family transcriptional regulator [Streptomyces phaeoluteigriseus]USQ89120.1 GntR family transcriptional regulator [Streptomyces phaeoluteigriseus]
MVEYRIDRHSGVATYVQIVQQTKQALRLGMLRPGDKLPTAREVVEATAINPNTVLKAYRELERDGLVEARRGVGTFVRRALSTAPADSPLRTELDEWAGRAHAAGLDRDDVSALFTAVLDEHFTDDRDEPGAARTARTARNNPADHTRSTKPTKPTDPINPTEPTDHTGPASGRPHPTTHDKHFQGDPS